MISRRALPALRAPLALGAALALGACKPTPVEPFKPSPLHCARAPLSRQSIQIDTTDGVWQAPLVAISGWVRDCDGGRLDLYDPAARRWVGHTSLPVRASLSSVTGRYLHLLARGDRQLFVDRDSAEIVLDTQDLPKRLPDYADRLFSRLGGHLEVRGDAVIIDLNDGRRVRWPQGDLLAPDQPRIPDPCHGRATRARDGFSGYGLKSKVLKGMSGVEPGAARIRFAPEAIQAQARIYAERADGSVALRSADAFFSPRVLTLSGCEGSARPALPAPLIVYHRGHLDRETAPHLLSRLDAAGGVAWTVTLPFAPIRGGVRVLDQRLFLLNGYEGVWVDLEKGALDGAVDFSRRDQDKSR